MSWGRGLPRGASAFSVGGGFEIVGGGGGDGKGLETGDGGGCGLETGDFISTAGLETGDFTSTAGFSG